MSKKVNLIIIGITVVMYIVNQFIKTKIPIEAIRWFISRLESDM